LTAANISDFIPIYGRGTATTSGTEGQVRAAVGKKLYVESLTAIVTSNSKDGDTVLRFRNSGNTVLQTTYGAAVTGVRSSTTLLTDGIIEANEAINFQFDATASTAGSVRVNNLWVLVYYLTQEEA